MSRAWIASSTPSSRDSIWNGKPAPSPYLHKQLDVTPAFVMRAIDVFCWLSVFLVNLMCMSDKPLKHYLFASDFDQTLTFNVSGYVLSELVGIPTTEFERKAEGMAKLNLVQQGAELAYLLLHDPEFRARVRKEHLYQVGKTIRLKDNIDLLYQVLKNGVDGYHFDFYVLSASPVEVIQSALEGIVPKDHIYGTEFV